MLQMIFYCMRSMSHILNITCWNVNGLFKRSLEYSKLNDHAFLQRICNFDIIALLETHSYHDDNTELLGFQAISYSRPKASQARKPSGGITVFYKSHLKGIKIVKVAEHAIWIKLQKQNFHLKNDIFLGFSYLPPEISTFSQKHENDILDTLEEDLRCFCNLGEVVLLGDLNARTSNDCEIIENDSDKFLPPHLNYQQDAHLPVRVNQDMTSNKRGKALIDLCTASGLRILNGRKPGDSLGYFTCHKYNGSSTVDYGLCSENLFWAIPYFHVHAQLDDLADHCQISLGFKVKNLPVVAKSDLPLSKLPPKYNWTKDSMLKFQQALCTPLIQNHLSSFNAYSFQ